MKPRQIIIDEDFKKLMPPLAPDEYKLLEESIKTEGCREPIVLWHTFLIDGYTRYEICQRNNIEFKTKSIIFRDNFASPAPSGKVSLSHFPNDNRDTVKMWIIKNQLGRRNLTDYDRGRVALQLKPIISEKKKRGRPKKENRTNLSSLDTRAEIAKIADLSEGTIDKIEKIEKEAPPEIKEQASSGEISINKAYTVTKKPTDREYPKLGPPSRGMQLARMAIMDLEQITDDDLERDPAFTSVKQWIADVVAKKIPIKKQFGILSALKYYFVRATLRDKKIFRRWLYTQGGKL